MEVFYDKTGSGVEVLDSEAIRQGHDLEDYVARCFMESTGLKVRSSNYMYRSVEYPFMIADIDRLVAGGDVGLECKTASAYSAGKWKDGNIPAHYVLQCYHYMAVTGKRSWYIAVAILGREFLYHKLEWDDGLVSGLVEAEKHLESLEAELQRTGVGIGEVQERYHVKDLASMPEELYGRVMKALARTKSAEAA